MNTDNNAFSLEFAKRLSEVVNEAWASGELMERVTPTTQELLRFWFSEEYCSLRSRNFHAGQRQAILNIIYLHEVLGVRNVLEYYEKVTPDLMPSLDLGTLSRQKYQMPKYAVKMATGTGKTWVMHALLLWQMLNAKREQEGLACRFTKNFLIIAPGLIVYDRLIDAFCGRMARGRDGRDFETNDFYLNQEVFIPVHYRQEVFSFIQNNVVTKEEGIGRKTTGDGLIALTNWHLFENQAPSFDPSPEEEGNGMLSVPEMIEELLPIRPGKAAGNDLGMLDRRFLRGSELEYLAELKDIMVINDEAHHIHELKRGGETEEVEWQKGLNIISEKKGERFFQVDFSATPYDMKGSGRNARKSFFPHIVVDFDLATAMRKGLVKTLLLDRRQELTELQDLDYKAVRDDRNKVCDLSDGQRLMLRAGLAKLKMLEQEFTNLDERKNPKMLVICEDTSVTPFVAKMMTDDGLAEEDVVVIDSNAKGEVSEEEWRETKKKLFDIDKYMKPKVIVSVLMLREGFDVNNICVIVPLRSSEAPILLEQIIGRGLRLMWREPEYQSTKEEDRKRVLGLHSQPKTYLDMLSIIEHPAFIRFYDELLEGGLAVEETGEVGRDGSTGDIIRVGLREGYEQFDFEWPVIVKDAEEELEDVEIDINRLAPFTAFPLERLRQFLAQDGETFISQEALSKTQFGRYKVTANLFTATSYNEYLQKLLRTITMRFDKVSSHREMPVPNIQINEARTIAVVDRYIRTRLFGQPFNPFKGNDWKILLSREAVVTKHIIEEMARAIFHLQEQILTIDAQVEHTKFSSVAELKMREAYSIETRKTIYERQAYPTHGGGLEQAFLEFLEKDGDVERYLKISENQHPFAIIYYIRADGLMATYHPDFIVATKDKVYLIETKGNDKLSDKNVRQKQTAAVEWTRKINKLKQEERMGRTWEYVLMGEDSFYALSSNGATLTDICERLKVSLSFLVGDFFAEC
ncbi:MAG: DEAD/DEAH box helicase family protein [Bacteroidaceae bacterium]|nr:DEAD/DEAH box helicase family protein [Bacteroidaceae bacterium]